MALLKTERDNVKKYALSLPAGNDTTSRLLDDIDKRHVLLAEPIKTLGMFTIKIQLHKEVETKIKLWIISDESK